MVLLVQKIVDAGGKYVMKSSEADLFATVDGGTDVEGNPLPCSRLNHVLEANQNGAQIEIITLDVLLGLLGTSKEELESAAPMDVTYLLDEKYSPKALT